MTVLFCRRRNEWYFSFARQDFRMIKFFTGAYIFSIKFKVSIGFLTTQKKVWTKYVPDVKEEFLTLEVYFLEGTFIVDKKKEN